MKILLKGYYGFGNLGDDILMYVTFNLLKSLYPHADILIFSNYSKNNKNAKNPGNYNNYIKHILESEVEIIDWTYNDHFDLILHGGGGVYFDKNEQGSPYKNDILRLLPISWITSIDKILRGILNKPKNLTYIKRIGVGIGIGNYTKGSKNLYDHFAEIGSYDKLIVRDKTSFNFLTKQKMNKGKYSINTDLAFINSWNIWDWRKRDAIKSVGIVVKDNLEDSLVISLIQLYQNLIDRNISVTFYSFDENYDINSPDIFARFNFTQYNPMGLYNFLDNLYNEDILFTTRAHGAILGACLGVPSIIINLELKLSEVSNMLKRSCIKIDSWDNNNLISAFENLDKNYPNTLKNLLLDFSENHHLSEKIGDLIKS